MAALIIKPGKLSYDELFRIHQHALTISLDKQSKTAINRAADTVAQVIKEGRTVYGINTGFGEAADRLGLTYHQFRGLLRKYREEGFLD